MDAAGSISHLLQLSVAPTALISGCGLLTLCATNRMAHLLDRLRALCAVPSPAHAGQIAVLVRRARLLRLVLVSFLLSMLAAVLAIAGLFVGLCSGASFDRSVAALFVGSLALLAAGLLGFAVEASLNLSAVILEVEADRTVA